MPVRKNIPEADSVRDRFIRSFEELRYRKLVKTKAEFCEAVGLATSSNLSRMEREQREPTISNILLLHKAYGVSLNWIMLGEGDVLG
jgi:transcriptional regulator with XRE-family HTH domain